MPAWRRIAGSHWLFYVVIQGVQDDAKSHSVWGSQKVKSKKSNGSCRRGGATFVLGLSDNNPYAAPAPGPHPAYHTYITEGLSVLYLPRGMCYRDGREEDLSKQS